MADAWGPNLLAPGAIFLLKKAVTVGADGIERGTAAPAPAAGPTGA